ncbi:MAG: hypothetical protein WCH39_22170 [Schlesneria sp.]
MPKTNFMNIAVECWKHSGKLGLAEPAICLHHEVVDMGRPILQALSELSSERLASQRTVTFVDSAREQSITTVRFRLVASRVDLRVMNVTSEPGVATIEMTEIGLPLIREALLRWFDGAEDFGVSVRHAGLKQSELGPLDRTSGELWFWGPLYFGP